MNPPQSAADVVQFSETSLARVGVALLDSDRPKLECRQCGQWWTPALLPGRRLPRGWWKCPNGCNVE